MGNPTFGQVQHLLTLVSQKKLTNEQLANLYNSGLLSDLLEIKDARTLNREAFRNLLGLSPLQYVITVNYDASFKEMCRAIEMTAGKGLWPFPFHVRFYIGLHEKKFPIVGTGIKKFECKLFDSGCSIEEGINRIMTAGFQPGKIEHLLKFAETFPRDLHWILAPGSRSPKRTWLGSIEFPSIVWEDSLSASGYVGRTIGCADFWSSQSPLGEDGQYRQYWRFLGVREVPLE